MIDLKNLTKTYSKDGVKALDNLTLDDNRNVVAHFVHLFNGDDCFGTADKAAVFVCCSCSRCVWSRKFSRCRARCQNTQKCK